MIPKKSRLPRDGFRARGYQVFASPYLSLKAKNNFLNMNRIGVTVGKSVDKRAARRNFLERQAKAQLLLAPNIGKDFVATIFPKASLLTKAGFVKELQKTISYFLAHNP